MSRSRSSPDRQRAARLAEIALSKCWHVPYGICGHCLEVALLLTIITIRGETRARSSQ